jgi:hypothetical protein
MSRSDWNSAVNLHIGANCYDAIANSNQFTTEQQNKLKAIADKLTAYCESKNSELGLDNTDAEAYRFGFVVEPGKKPYFINLPSFGSYKFDDNQQFKMPNGDDEREPINLCDGVLKKSSQTTKNNPPCTKCGSTNTKPFGSQGRYQCLNKCGQKTFRPKAK